MELYDYFKSLDDDGREGFASRAETSVNYLSTHIMKPRPRPIKGASVPYMQRLSEATEGAVSLHEVLSHFTDREHYSGTERQVAA